MKKAIYFLVSLGLIFLMVGCATLMSGGPSWLTVETNPSNIEAKIYEVSTMQTITKHTPFKMELSKASDYKIVLESPNYRSEEILIRRSINGWFWGNIFLGGILGVVIDFATNNMWDHNQHLISIDMTDLGSMPDHLKINIPIMVLNDNKTSEIIYLPVNFYKKS